MAYASHIKNKLLIGKMLNATRLIRRITPIFKKTSSQKDPQTVKINIAM
jgi:hypothetical protein